MDYFAGYMNNFYLFRFRMDYSIIFMYNLLDQQKREG